MTSVSPPSGPQATDGAPAASVGTAASSGHDSTKLGLSTTATRELSPLNGAVLLTGTVVGITATVAADVFASHLPAALPLACAMGWLAAVSFILALLGRGLDGAPAHPRTPRQWLACLRSGAAVARRDRWYSLLLGLMAAFAAYAGYVKVRSDPAQSIASLVKTSEAIRNEASAARSRVERLDTIASRQAAVQEQAASATAELARQVAALHKPPATALPASPAELLRREGRWNNAAFGEALLRGEADSIRLYVAAGWEPQSEFEEGNAVGHFAWRGGAISLVRQDAIVKALSGRIDWHAKVARFRGFPPVSVPTAAVMGCNATLLAALAKNDVDLQRVETFDMPGRLTSEVIAVDPVRFLKQSACADADKRAILALLENGAPLKPSSEQR